MKRTRLVRLAAAASLALTTVALAVQGTGAGAPSGTTGGAAPRGKPAGTSDGVVSQQNVPGRKAPAGATGTTSPAGKPNATQGELGTPVNLQGQQPGGELAPAEPPAIKFEPEVLDLGEMIVDTAKTGKIKLRNVTDKPITVIKAIPGCGCTTAGWPKEPIPAGEAAEVEITLKPGSKAGIPLHKKVTFQLQDHAPVVLSVTGNIPAYVTVTPELLDAPSTNKPGNDGVKISSVDNTAFKVVSITPPIAMEEDAKAAADNAKTEHQIRIDWKKWEETGKGIKLVFALDHPKAPTMGVLIKRPISDTPSQRPPNAPPVAADKPGANNLVLAARQGDVERVKLELANGTDVNLVDRASRRAALHWAARENRLEVVDALLAANANLEVRDGAGKTPLTVAAESGRADVVKKLLAAKADVNTRDQIQGSPLLWAAGLGNPETVQVLLEAGADPSVVDVNGLTPLLWAAGIGDPRTVELLLKTGKANVDAKDNISEDTALMRAARSGKPESVMLLLAANASTSAKNRTGLTPFLIACGSGKLGKVKALAAKSDVTVKDNRGWNALDHARNRTDDDRTEVIKYLEEELKIPASGTSVPPQGPSTPAKPGTPAASAAPAGNGAAAAR